MILMVLFWGALIGVIVWAAVRVARSREDRPGHQVTRETPEDILARRFALGEIDADAYEQARGRLAERGAGGRG